MGHSHTLLLVLTLVVVPLVGAWLAIARVVRRQDAHSDSRWPSSGGT